LSSKNWTDRQGRREKKKNSHTVVRRRGGTLGSGEIYEDLDQEVILQMDEP